MKKLLFFISALAGLFLATSCEREEMAPASANAVVSYSIEVPTVTTRALGDNVSNINDLVYAVYSTEATSLDEAKTANDLQPLYQKNFAEDDSKFSVVDGVNRATVDIELINNKNYVVLFWAQNHDKWISGNSFDLRNVGYPAEMSANNNDYAAFSGADFISSDNLSVKKNLPLERAVAQINIGTKGADNFNVGLVSSSVIVKNAGEKFNVLTKTAQGVKDVEFKTANTISAEELSVNSINYLYAAMNYVFANGNVEVDYTINYNLTNSNGEQINGSVNNSVPDVPVAQNYRTNIVGKLLTSTADYTIELEGFSTNSNSGNIEVVAEGIVKNQNDDYEISSENGMVYAMNNLFAQGGNFYVVKSLNMTGYEVEAPVIPNGTTFNFFVEIPIVTRAAEQITIEGLKYLIGKVESGATVSISGVTMPDNTTGAVIKEVVDGATVYMSECTVNGSNVITELVETGSENAVDVTNIKSFESLKKAINSDFNIINISADITANEVIEISKSITINGSNEYSINTSANRIFRIATSEVEVTFNDLNMVSTAVRIYPSDVIGVSIDPQLSDVKLTLNNCTIDFTDITANDWTYAVNVSGNGTGHKVNIIGGTYEGANVVNVHGASNVITVKNATLNCIYPYNEQYMGACIWVKEKENSSVYAEGNTYNGNYAVAYNLGTGTALEEKNNTDNTRGIEIYGNNFTIVNVNGLKWIAEQVNEKDNYFAGKTIILGTDIDLNNQEWTPIGSAAKDHGFMGNFDGNGKTIKNLKIKSITPDADNYVYAALFGVTEGTETERNYIKNLIIENVDILTEGHIVSAAVAYPYYTTIENITVKGDINITGGNYTSGVLAYTRRCVDAKDLSIAGNAGSYITGNQAVGGVISDIQMNGGLKAKYSNFKAEGLTITATKNVGGISGIIAGQTLNGATVKDVNIVSDDVRKGIVAGALGEKSTITNIVVNNVKGATDVVGAAYSTPQDYEIIENNGEYTAELKYSVSEDGNTYTISSAAGLIWFADQVNVQKNAFNGKTVKLAANIDLANILWTPIGQTGATTFNGVFDGLNYTIYNLNINSESQTGAHYSSGLFGWVESHTAGHGHLKNIRIEGATVNGHHNCGALVGYITQETALVENCHVTDATIVCTKANNDADGDKAGALIGNATVATPVKDCTASNSTVSAGRDAGQVIGAGKAANVTGCSATNVTVSANGTSTGANIKNEVIGRNL